MQHGTCKHIISFKLNVLSHAVPEQYDITALCTRKKRGRPKKVSSVLTVDVPETINLLDDDEDDNDDLEDGKICGMAMQGIFDFIAGHFLGFMHLRGRVATNIILINNSYFDNSFFIVEFSMVCVF